MIYILIMMWTDREIEEAIRNAFARLGYPTVKIKQLEAAREFVKGKGGDTVARTLSNFSKFW